MDVEWGFEFTETVSIFIRRLMEMCVRLRSGSGSRGEGRAKRGTGQGLGRGREGEIVCGWVGVVQREQAILSGEKKMSRMPLVNECKANVELQQHPLKFCKSPPPT